MKRGTRDTIRRKPDYERDPDWDILDIIEGPKRQSKRGTAASIRSEDDSEHEGRMTHDRESSS